MYDRLLKVVSVVALAAVLSPLGASAQQAASPAPTGRLVLGGVLGGAAGIAAGGLVGAYIGGNHCHDEGNPDSCHGLDGMVIGASAGQTLTIPMGVHLMNERRGNLGLSMLASAGIAGAGALVAFGLDTNAAKAGAWFTVPVLQLVSSVLIERATTR